jgi:methylmalonyl-CoA mutase N-terminal domain/subunit
LYDRKYLEKDREKKEKWEKLYEILKEHDVKFVIDFEIPIKKLYTPLDVKGDHLDKVNFPGQEPYTGSVYSTMYRGRLWTMRLFSGHIYYNSISRQFKNF